MSTTTSVPSALSPIARWRSALVAATMVSVLFATIFLAALGDPKPHDVPVAAIGLPDSARSVEEALNARTSGGFDVQAVADVDAARDLLAEREVFGVLDTSSDRATIHLASFNGAALNGVVEGALTGVAAAESGRIPTIDDIHEGEGKPTSVFYIVFGMVIAAMAFTIASGALTPLAAVGGWRQRLVATTVTSVVVGAAVSLVALGFDALPGHYAQVGAVAALLMFALAASIQGVVLNLGARGLVLCAVFFIMIGNAASGAAVHPLLLGSPWRELSPLLPTGAGATAVVDVAAFSGTSIVQPLIVLVAWAALGKLLVIVGIRRKLAVQLATEV